MATKPIPDDEDDTDLDINELPPANIIDPDDDDSIYDFDLEKDEPWPGDRIHKEIDERNKTGA